MNNFIRLLADRVSRLAAILSVMAFFCLQSAIASQSDSLSIEDSEDTADLQKRVRELLPEEEAFRSIASVPEIESLEKDPDAPARTVFIRLEKIENIGRYDIEIKPDSSMWTEPMAVRTKAGSLRIRLTPSKYKIRTRSVTHSGLRGPWGSWKSFLVPFRSVTDRVPAEGAQVQNTGNQTQIITFEWPKLPQASGYYMEIRTPEGKSLRRLRLKTAYIGLSLQGDRSYQWCVLPMVEFNRDPAPGECKFTTFTVNGQIESLSKALTEVEPHPEATGYQFEVIRFEKASSGGDAVIVQSESHEMRAELLPGEYEMRARTLFPQNRRTAWSPPKKFFVPHKPPPPIFPLSGVEIEGEEDENARITLAWQPQPDAVEYTVFVYKPSGELVHSETTKETQLKLQLPEGETYRWQVSAYSEGEPRRAPASVQMDPKASSEFYIKPYMPFNFSPAENPAPLYAWARYVASSANYYSESYDDNAIIRQSIQAGELNLATGYWHRKSRLGLLINAGIQNYKTTQESVFQKNGSLSFGYRLLWEGDQRARIWAGYAYREIPSVTGNPSTQIYRINRITSAGPQLIFSYMNSLSAKMGYQLHSRFFYGLQDMGTPNEMPQTSALALSASAALSYKVSPKLLGLIGYTYQLDQGGYKSADTPGKTNTTSVKGHYLTFGVEWAISDPKR